MKRIAQIPFQGVDETSGVGTVDDAVIEGD
jgi:hypothetical protein